MAQLSCSYYSSPVDALDVISLQNNTSKQIQSDKGVVPESFCICVWIERRPPKRCNGVGGALPACHRKIKTSPCSSGRISTRRLLATVTQKKKKRGDRRRCFVFRRPVFGGKNRARVDRVAPQRAILREPSSFPPLTTQGTPRSEPTVRSNGRYFS